MMVTRMTFGGIGSVVLVVTALWAWGHAPQLADNAHRPEVALWAARCAAVALATGAQVMLLTLVTGGIYRRRLSDDVMRLTAALVCTLALVSAVALALAGK
jgi:hypothetical protein